MTIEVSQSDWQCLEFRRAVMGKARLDAKRERKVYKIVMVQGRARWLMATIDAR